MILEQHDLHNKNLNEATDTVQRCIKWMIEHGLLGCVFIHGKGKHSNGVPVLKQEIRRYLEESEELKKSNYVIVKGEDDYAITETLNDAHVVVIKAGHENDSLCGDKRQQEKARVLFSEEGKEERKQKKKNKKRKHNSPRQIDSNNHNDQYATYRTPRADSELEKYDEGVAILGEVSWLSSTYLDIIVLNVKQEKVGMINTELSSQLGPVSKNLKLINGLVPGYLKLYKDTSLYVESDFDSIEPGNIILIYKYDNDYCVRTFVFK